MRDYRDDLRKQIFNATDAEQNLKPSDPARKESFQLKSKPDKQPLLVLYDGPLDVKTNGLRFQFWRTYPNSSHTCRQKLVRVVV